jgi:hypothetical protein
LDSSQRQPDRLLQRFPHALQKEGAIGAVEDAVVAGGAAVVLLNVWTGAPLLALLAGSRVQGPGHLSMGTVFTVIHGLRLETTWKMSRKSTRDAAWHFVCRPPRAEPPPDGGGVTIVGGDWI